MSGAAVLIVPVSVYLVKRLGARRAFILAGMLSAISTAFMPMAAYSGVSAFIIARIGQGIPLAFNLPIIGSITSGWSTVKYSGIFMAIASGFVQLAPVFTMPMAGIVCTSSLGWPMVYYIHAAVTILLFTLWAIFYKDSPQRQPLVTKKELDVITFGKSPPISRQRAPILAMFTSPAVWAIWLTVFANFAGMQLFVIFMPVYMHKILGLPLKTASILAALPPLSQMFIKLLAVYLSDHVKFFSSTSLTSKLRLFNSISSLGGGLLLLILAFIPTSNLLWSLIFLIISSSMLGFNTSGVFRSTSLVAKQHAYLVTGVIQFIYCFVLLTMPFAIDALAATRPNNDWSMVFVIIAFLLTFTNIFFCAFGKGSPAPWTGITISKSINKVQPAQISTISGAA
uniref:Major facilitator superfamily (MFS) profile domain-containing protein n=1 Tax=Plectus sambesii TaxID=2011161 RepID=A0A914WH37_9BILA